MGLVSTCLLLLSAASELTPEVPLHGELVVAETLAPTPQLQLDPDLDACPGRVVRLEIPPDGDGVYAITLRSVDFNPFLVVRGEDGAIIDEDDDSGPELHARCLVYLEGDRAYDLLVFSKKLPGEFELICDPHDEETGDVTLQTAAEDVARERARRAEERWGDEDPRRLRVEVDIATDATDLHSFDGAAEALHEVLVDAVITFGDDHPEVRRARRLLVRALRAAGRLEEGRAIAEETLSKWPADSADVVSRAGLLIEHGLILARLGDYHRSRQSHAESVGALKRVLPPPHPLVGDALGYLGAAERSRGAFAEALAAYEESLQVREATFGPDTLKAADSLNRIALLYWNRGLYEEAERYVGRALTIQEERLHPESSRLATTWTNRAEILRNLGRHDEARPLLERALRVREAVLGPDHPDVAATLNNLSLVLGALSLEDQAEDCIRRSLAIVERALGPDHPHVASAAANLARVLARRDRYDEAIELFQRVIQIREARLRPGHPLIAGAQNGLGSALIDVGRDAEARPILEQALANWEVSLGPDHPTLGFLLLNLAGLDARRGDWEIARERLDRAARVMREALGDEHPNAIHTALARGQLAFDRGDEQGAWQIIQSVAPHQSLWIGRVLWAGTEAENFHTLAGWRRHLNLVLGMASRLQMPEAQTFAHDSLLDWKGRATRLLVSSRASLTDGLPDELDALVRSIRMLRGELSTRVLRVPLETNPDAAELESVRSRLHDAERRWRDLRASAVDDRVDTDQIRAALPEGFATISFAAHPTLYRMSESDARAGPPRLAAWIVRRDRDHPTHVDIGLLSDVEAAIRDERAELDPARGVSRARPAFSTDADIDREASPLWRSLWPRVSPHLTEISTVVVSSSGALSTVPLEVLRAGDGTYLIEQYRFVYLHDLTELVRMVPIRTREHDSLLSLGMVDFQGVPPADDADDEPTLRGWRFGKPQFWGALPATEYESQVIHDMHRAAFPSSSRELVQGAAASESRLKHLLPSHSVLHLATHGFFHGEDERSAWDDVADQRNGRGFPADPASRLLGDHPGILSGIVLAGANTASPGAIDDGYLCAEEVSWLDLSKADLVVLSACGTGLGSPRSGEGLIGLRRAFRAAGARTVISSLWTVPDSSTSDLMQDFYRRLWIEQMSCLDALRSAQIEMLRDNRRRSGDARPTSWGAFVLDGDWR